MNFALLALLFALSRCDAYAKKGLVDKGSVKVRGTYTTLTAEDFVRARQSLTEIDATALEMEGKMESMDDIIEEETLRSGSIILFSGVRDKRLLWPNGVVPYVISSDYNEGNRTVIAGAMDLIERQSCVRFVKRNPRKHYDYIVIEPTEKGRCKSSVGRVTLAQEVNLEGECVKTGIVLHELMHALGFFHEHKKKLTLSRNDRDDYVDIVWDKMDDNMTKNYEKHKLELIDHLDLPYDYNSIMHYPINKLMKGKKEGSDQAGQLYGLSRLDVKKLNKLYKCKTKKEECEDTSFFCRKWINCEARKIFHEVCRKTCGTCIDDTPTTATAATSTSTSERPTPRRRCRNVMSDFACDYAILYGAGCKADNVIRECAKACKLC